MPTWNTPQTSRVQVICLPKIIQPGCNTALKEEGPMHCTNGTCVIDLCVSRPTLLKRSRVQAVVQDSSVLGVLPVWSRCLA